MNIYSKYFFTYVLFVLFFNITSAQNLQYEYLIKLPDYYFTNNTIQSINDKSYNETYFETKESININLIFKEEKDDLNSWLLLKSEKKLDSKFSTLLNKSKLLHFQNNNILRIQSIPNDSLYSKQWYHKKVRAASSWTYFQPVEKIILAVIDTGIDYNHPELVNSIWINTTEDLNNNNILDSLDLNNIDDDGNGYIDDVIGWDFTDAPRFPDAGDYLDPDNNPMDEFQNGHGTQIAGIISAQANNGIGISGLTPEIDVMNLRAGTASGFLEEDDVAEAIVYAIDNGAKIINMSFGDVVVSSFLNDVIQYAHSQNVILIASSGNSGTNEQHYPSGFAETISVGATDSLDAIAGFSSWGQTLDLTAPGQNIISCKIGGGYNYSNGTSFSAPMVASAAAFILSNNPYFSNEQVRNILKSTTDDFGVFGWDPYFGSGRLNLFNVSQVNYESELRIEYPKSGMYTSKDSISILATIQDADLESASLQYGIGDNPNNWQTLIPNIQNQVISDTIAQFDISNFSDTTIVLKLIASTWQGNIKEYRSILNIDKTTPIIYNLQKIPVFDENRRAIILSFNTDDITRGEIHLRPKSSSQSFIVKNLNYETKNHKILIRSDDISDNIEFEIRIQNLAGLETFTGLSSQYEFYLSPDIIPDFNFTKLAYSLPKGFILPKTTDFDHDGNEEIVISLYNEYNSFGYVAVFEFENNKFIKRTETSFPAIPRDYGDSDNDGKEELLLGFGRTSYIYEASIIDGFPDIVVWKDSTDFWVSQITDLDRDGISEILGRSGTSYKLLENVADNSFIEKFIFSNPTTGNNTLGPPTTIISDFDNDALPDLAFGDYDGDYIIYENIGDDAFVQRYQEKLPLPDATDFLTSGLFFDIQRSSFLVGTHTDNSEIYESEFNSRYWSFSHILSQSDNNYSNEQTINFFGYNDIREFDSGVSTGADSSKMYDYVLFSVFPDLYIFQFDGDSLVPIWYLNNVQSNKIILNDFDKNGAPELYFNDGDSILAFEFGSSNRPLPPSNVEAFPLDTSSIQISWNPIINAQKYIIFRGLNDSTLSRYDSVLVDNSFRDTLLINGTNYYYGLQSFDNLFQNPYSSLSKIEKAKPNNPPQIDTVIAVNSNQVQIYFNELMLKSSFLANNFQILPSQKFASSAIPLKNGLGVLLTFSNEFRVDTLNTVKITDVRDLDKTLINSTYHIVQFYFETIEKTPYIKQWELQNRNQLIVTFNMPMDIQTIYNLENYVLEPSGEIVDVLLLDNYDMEFKISLSNGSYAGATGVPTYITFNNIKSSTGITFDKGNRFSLTKSTDNLNNLIVYPQPVRSSSEYVTFANITDNTEIKIFDINGKLIRDLAEEDRDGGISWDIKNNKGEKVAAGIYIYYAIHNKETKTGKIAILR